MEEFMEYDPFEKALLDKTETKPNQTKPNQTKQKTQKIKGSIKVLN